MFATHRTFVVIFAMALLGSAACERKGGGNPNDPSDAVVITVTPEAGKLGDILTVVPTLKDGDSATFSCSASLGELSKTSGIASGSKVMYFSRNAGTENLSCQTDSISGTKSVLISAPPADSGYLPLNTPLRFVYDDDGTPAPLTVTISVASPSFGSQVIGGFFGLPEGGTSNYCIDHINNCWGFKGEFRWDDGVTSFQTIVLYLSDTPGGYESSFANSRPSQVTPFDTLPKPGSFTTFSPQGHLKYFEGKADHLVRPPSGPPVIRRTHLPPQATGWHF